MKIVCSGMLVRYPLGGFSWHHLQYVLGFAALGHDVTYFEDFGWAASCYDAGADAMTDDPSYGLSYLESMFQAYGGPARWCYLAADGRAHGIERAELADHLRDCDVYFDLSNINWIDELGACRRRVLIDTDPVFTQMGGFGMSKPDSERHHVRFTYAENIGKASCSVPTAGVRWLPTRQPVYLKVWPAAIERPAGPFSTVMNWSAYGDRTFEGKIYGQKDRQFEPFFTLPQEVDVPMEIAVQAPPSVAERLRVGGWRLTDPKQVTIDPATFQRYLARSRGEFSVAKHAYVTTRSGWFSDRTTGYLATGRPAVVEDTGFSDVIPTGDGLLSFASREQAITAIRKVLDDYDVHARAARQIVEAHFDSAKVLTRLLSDSLA